MDTKTTISPLLRLVVLSGGAEGRRGRGRGRGRSRAALEEEGAAAKAAAGATRNRLANMTSTADGAERGGKRNGKNYVALSLRTIVVCGA